MDLTISQEAFAEAINHLIDIIELIDETVELIDENNELIVEMKSEYIDELEEYQSEVCDQFINLKEITDLLTFNLTQCCGDITNLDEEIAKMINNEVS